MTDESILQKIQTDITAAMRAKDADTLSTLRMLKSAIMEAKTKKAKDAVLAADEEIDIVQRYARKRRESVEELRKLGRDDLALKEEQEIAVTARYLPEPLDEAALRAVVREAIATTGAAGPRDMGKVIGLVMGQVKGRAEGGDVSRLVKEALAAQG